MTTPGRPAIEASGGIRRWVEAVASLDDRDQRDLWRIVTLQGLIVGAQEALARERVLAEQPRKERDGRREAAEVLAAETEMRELGLIDGIDLTHLAIKAVKAAREVRTAEQPRGEEERLRLRRALRPFDGCWSWGPDVGIDEVLALEDAARAALNAAEQPRPSDATPLPPLRPDGYWTHPRGEQSR